ncbi:MAG: hypothetical protein HUJ54_14065, partial [Erysipelotrichaceae bacterium]|nr:hypothetical protein [Erysipelotrichaceae bacterium]
NFINKKTPPASSRKEPLERMHSEEEAYLNRLLENQFLEYLDKFGYPEESRRILDQAKKLNDAGLMELEKFANLLANHPAYQAKPRFEKKSSASSDLPESEKQSD